MNNTDITTAYKMSTFGRIVCGHKQFIDLRRVTGSVHSTSGLFVRSTCDVFRSRTSSRGKDIFSRRDPERVSRLLNPCIPSASHPGYFTERSSGFLSGECPYDKTLRFSSSENEYYLGGRPSTLQYTKNADEIVKSIPYGFETADLSENRYNNGYQLCDHRLDTIRSVIPNTLTAKRGDWQILVIMKKENEDGTIWLKVGMRNRKNGKIALMTSTNRKDLLNRPIKSLNPDWFIGHYRMSAPIYFWKELANRIVYSL